MNLNLYANEETVQSVGKLPRDMSASKIMRYVIKAIFTPDKQWREFQKTDVEAAAVRAYLRKKLLPRLQD